MFESFDDYDLDENLLRHRAAKFTAKICFFNFSFFGGSSFLGTFILTCTDVVVPKEIKEAARRR